MAQLNNSANGGPRQSTFFSQAAREASAAASDCESGVGEVDSVAGTADGEGPSSSTLSISFKEPLTGPQRLELIQRIIETHPAFRTAQQLQECIYKTQTSLRRMPGVASLEAKEVGERLQETSRLVSREYAGLLEQHARMTLDFKETELGAERLTQDAILHKHRLEDKTARFDKLFADYVAERERRERYERDIRGIAEYMDRLATQLRGVMGKVLSGCEASTHAEVVQDLEGLVASLDEKARASPCGWGSSSSGSGSGSAGIMTPLSSTALVRTAEQAAPMSPANKEAVTSRLKAMGLLGEDGDDTRPSSVMGRPMFDLPRTPVNSRSMVPAFDRPPTRNSFTPMTAGASPGPGHYNNRSRGSTFSMNSNNFGAGGPRSRAASVSNNAMPFQPPPSFNGGMKSLRGGGGGFFNQNKNPGNYGFPNLDLAQASVRPGTAFEGYRDSRNGLNGRADSFPGSSSAASTNGLVLTPPTSSSSSSAAALLTDRLVQKWQTQIRVFYKSLHAWVERFASPDQPTADSIGGTGLWPVLLRSYRPLAANEAASYLEFHLKDSLSRYCLVTRVIVDYVVNLVWLLAGWKGADIPSTDALTVLEKDLKAVKDRPAYERQPLLNRQAELVESILREYPNFIADKTKHAVSSILANLGPMLVRPCNTRPGTAANGTNTTTGANGSTNIRAEASAQLRDILRQAYEISEIMMTSRITFDFRFPLIGSRFTSQSMVNIWPSAVDPLELQAKHWRVALVVSPVITCRSDTGTDISAHAVASADVFCMQ